MVPSGQIHCIERAVSLLIDIVYTVGACPHLPVTVDVERWRGEGGTVFRRLAAEIGQSVVGAVALDIPILRIEGAEGINGLRREDPCICRHDASEAQKRMAYSYGNLAQMDEYRFPKSEPLREQRSFQNGLFLSLRGSPNCYCPLPVVQLRMSFPRISFVPQTLDLREPSPRIRRFPLVGVELGLWPQRLFSMSAKVVSKESGHHRSPGWTTYRIRAINICESNASPWRIDRGSA